ncbi:MAG: hypothetical protein EZS28_011488 [Streblomastix strix]|uniref:Uncharacterized protein n=1 Tax=Streblomastix strix TaxID=222440 RepID=A0A5J4WDE3_9EUKA|nr:MAG: hypothetical protein EZS28_011488 [Streblomastix strix]
MQSCSTFKQGLDKESMSHNDAAEKILKVAKKLAELQDPEQTNEQLFFKQDLLRKVVAIKLESFSLSMDKIVKDRIHSVSARLYKCNQGAMNGAVGIVNADYKIHYLCNPTIEPHRQNMLFYFGFDGQLIIMELNADVGTPLFFVDSIQKPVFVKGINEPVKFYFWIYFKDSSFEIEQVKKLTSPVAKVLTNKKAMQL